MENNSAAAASLFIEDAELEAFTGCKTKGAQEICLKRKRIKHFKNLKGLVLVRAVYNQVPQEKWPNDVLPSNSEILGLDELPRSMIGVYFLCQGKTVVYVGKTTNFYGRMGSHADSNYEFDNVRFLPVHIKNLDAIEREYIVRFCPKYNIAHKPIYDEGPNLNAFAGMVDADG